MPAERTRSERTQKNGLQRQTESEINAFRRKISPGLYIAVSIEAIFHQVLNDEKKQGKKRGHIVQKLNPIWRGMESMQARAFSKQMCSAKGKAELVDIMKRCIEQKLFWSNTGRGSAFQRNRDEAEVQVWTER